MVLKQVFIVNAPQDDAAVEELCKHLAPLLGTRLVVHRAQDTPAGDRTDEFLSRLKAEAGPVLTVLSADLLANSALLHTLQDLGPGRLVPVLWRACLWDKSLFAELRPLPADETFVFSCPDRDEAWRRVVHGVSALLGESPVLQRTAVVGPLLSSPRPLPLRPDPKAEARGFLHLSLRPTNFSGTLSLANLEDALSALRSDEDAHLSVFDDEDGLSWWDPTIEGTSVVVLKGSLGQQGSVRIAQDGSLHIALLTAPASALETTDFVDAVHVARGIAGALSAAQRIYRILLPLGDLMVHWWLDGIAGLRCRCPGDWTKPQPLLPNGISLIALKGAADDCHIPERPFYLAQLVDRITTTTRAVLCDLLAGFRTTESERHPALTSKTESLFSIPNRVVISPSKEQIDACLRGSIRIFVLGSGNYLVQSLKVKQRGCPPSPEHLLGQTIPLVNEPNGGIVKLGGFAYGPVRYNRGVLRFAGVVENEGCRYLRTLTYQIQVVARNRLLADCSDIHTQRSGACTPTGERCESHWEMELVGS